MKLRSGELSSEDVKQYRSSPNPPFPPKNQLESPSEETEDPTDSDGSVEMTFGEEPSSPCLSQRRSQRKRTEPLKIREMKESMPPSTSSSIKGKTIKPRQSQLSEQQTLLLIKEAAEKKAVNSFMRSWESHLLIYLCLKKRKNPSNESGGIKQVFFFT